MIFAGKAHPQDQMGKDLIKNLVQISNRENLRRYIVFIEDYDMEVARYMVQGVDIWLNTPRRPLEACGTSGMKAVANGALHMSVLDGWWDEGFNPDIGWAIGSRIDYQDHDFQDDLESRTLYDILEKDVVPLFYDRGQDGLPRGWLAMMKSSLHMLCPMFNTHRMVMEYWTRFYVPSATRRSELVEKDWDPLKALANWREKIMYNWSGLKIRDIRMEGKNEIEIGESYHVEADIELGGLSQEDIMVEAYYGRLDPSNKFTDSFTSIMVPKGEEKEGVFCYKCDIGFEEVGHFGLNVRITPNHPTPGSRHSMGLVIWGSA
jgi:starch phosphorylase